MFREAMGGRGKIRQQRLDEIQPLPLASDQPKAVEESLPTSAATA